MPRITKTGIRPLPFDRLMITFTRSNTFPSASFSDSDSFILAATGSGMQCHSACVPACQFQQCGPVTPPFSREVTQVPVPEDPHCSLLQFSSHLAQWFDISDNAQCLISPRSPHPFPFASKANYWSWFGLRSDEGCLASCRLPSGVAGPFAHISFTYCRPFSFFPPSRFRMKPLFFPRCLPIDYTLAASVILTASQKLPSFKPM